MVMARLALVLLIAMSLGAAVPASALPVPGVGGLESCNSGVGIILGGMGLCCDTDDLFSLRPMNGCRNK